MRYYVSLSYSLGYNGTVGNYVSGIVTNAPIRNLDDIKAVEKAFSDEYSPVAEKKGCTLVSVSVITWRPFDE